MIEILAALALTVVIGCGSSGNGGGGSPGSGGSGGGAGAPSGPGPLVDNTQWVVTTDGDELIGPPPPGAECTLEPIDCEDYYPWPEGDCVAFEPGSPCVTSYVPECLDSFTVMAIYTRMPDPREVLCNWLTLEQPSLRDIRAGDEVEIRMRHSQLTAPIPGSARMVFTIGDQVALDYDVLIPSDFQFPSQVWTADKDYPAGTQLLFHVDNHGSNEYMLIEVNIL